MSEGIDSILPTPIGDGRPMQPGGPSIWRAVGVWTVRVVVVAGGLGVGAILGLIVSLVTGIIEIRC